jgi:hypothetical protein
MLPFISSTDFVSVTEINRIKREVKMAKSSTNFIGSWAFLIGVVLAVILGLVGNIGGTWTIVLIVIGLIVGILNVAEKETMPFLMSGTVLIIASALGKSGVSDIQILADVLNALLIIFIPATVIVAIKNVFSLARS